MNCEAVELLVSIGVRTYKDLFGVGDTRGRTR